MPSYPVYKPVHYGGKGKGGKGGYYSSVPFHGGKGKGGNGGYYSSVSYYGGKGGKGSKGGYVML